MTEAGAEAFVSKHAPTKDLIEAIRRACRRKVGQ
jgi:DNA-binding NarL/FixJ family response regulator